METFLEILKMLAAAISGGGLLWLFNLRARIRRSGNEISEADFNTVSKVVKSAMDDLATLADRIGVLEQEKAKILAEIAGIRQENEALKVENKKMDEALRRLMKKNNPTMR